MNHNPETCTFCRRNHWLMQADCVADELGLRAVTVRLREAGTACLTKIKQGRSSFWVRAQVEAHKKELRLKGRCNGACLSVLKAGESETVLPFREREAG